MARQQEAGGQKETKMDILAVHVNLAQGFLEIFYDINKKILRVPLAQNRTFQVSLKTIETQFISYVLI